MGCGPKAAAEREAHLFFEERMAALKKVTPETWDTFLDSVDRLLEDIESGKLMSIARSAVTVKDDMKYIRRVGTT
jgi:hypothetical protein